MGFRTKQEQIKSLIDASKGKYQEEPGLLDSFKQSVGQEVPTPEAPPVHHDAIGGGYTSTPSHDMEEERAAQYAPQIEAGQAQFAQQAAQSPDMAAKLAAFQQMVQQRNEQERLKLMGQIPSVAEQIRKRNAMQGQ